ncbi:MAG: gamma-glutamyl-gamma-aminobutyrate hydrolase family protein [Actinomycetota bacterium]|nr:gamma-glutamyl-gamma-aminobutyrate hydrolase family protein [Actinomycetota bacterium]
MHVYVVADDAGREAGFVGEQLENRGASLIYVERNELPDFATLEDPALLLLLGSDLAAHEPANADVVRSEAEFALNALDAGIPVIAICYGAQLLARALGGTSYRAPEPELGWCLVDTTDPALCPPGPWPQLHKDVFVAPPTAKLLAESPTGHQAFIDESRTARAIAWQFHPEVTAARFILWVDEDADYYEAAGADTQVLRDETRKREAANREAAHQLTDAALDYLGLGSS